MPNEIELISLSELIDKIKTDLLNQARPQDEAPLLFVDEIEITAQVVAKREKGEGGKAGLSLSVLGFGADAGVDTKTTVAHELTQTIKLKLSPLHDKKEFLKARSPAERTAIAKAGLAMARGGGADSGQETL